MERRLFERVFIIYALVEYQLFMGIGEPFKNQCSAFLPRNIWTELDSFIMLHYDHFYKIFVQFWSSHKIFHACTASHNNNIDDTACSAALICDGHMKIRRRLCANSDVPLTLPIHFSPLFKDLFVGCSRTPMIHGRLCIKCKNKGVLVPLGQRYTKKQQENAKRKSKAAQKILANDMGSVSIKASLLYSIIIFISQD